MFSSAELVTDDQQPNSGQILRQVLAQFPSLPSIIRYYDDFDDKLRSIPDFSTADQIVVSCSGSKISVDFAAFGYAYGTLLKQLFVFLNANDYRMSTICFQISWFAKLPEKTISDLLAVKPGEMNRWWATERSQAHYKKVFESLKSLLRMLCANIVNDWSPDYLSFIAGLPLPSVDKYAAVRTGDVFLSTEEEAQIVHYFDNLAAKILSGENIDQQTLVEGSALLCSYLFAMRPYQIASLTMRDVRIWREDDTGTLYVHLTFKMIKQRTKSTAYPLTRRVKHEWAPIISEQYRCASAFGRSGADRFLGVNSAQAMSQLIVKVATQVAGVNVSATDLRHSAAQRLVDAGASQEEVAEFMGHADITTCLVYYNASPNQAERVNKALGISPVYQQVAKIAHAKFIDPEELAQLKDDQQIAGVPHGVPISGIGGCMSGQLACQFNPITSCYSCQKFMPVIDVTLHKRVLGEMRSVVKFFADISRHDTNSPAFMQLKRTIFSIQQVITELEAPANA